MTKQQYSRLTLTERRQIEHALNRGDSLKKLAKALRRSTSTVSREVMRNSIAKRGGSERRPFNDCLHRHICKEHDVCTNEECTRNICPGCVYCIHACKKYVRERCPLLSKAPYVCNGCKKRWGCTLEKFLYKAKKADTAANTLLSEARSGVAIDEHERRRLSDIVSPLIRKHQSPYHICLINKDSLMISDKTLYKYIAAGLMDAKSTDLLRKVKMKPRRKKPQPKVERACYEGRTYRDLLSHLDGFPDTEIVQMDTVIGAKGGGEKCLLTISFPHSELMLAFIRDANTARSVASVFDWMKRQVGYTAFTELFPLILTDRGSEFSAPSAIEFGDDAFRWTSIFYCDPNCAYQKPEIESGHRLIRMVLQKGTSFNRLAQSDIDKLMSHINSYKRKALGGRSPIEVFSKMHGNTIVGKLGLKPIQSHKIDLSPSLLK
jgi:IS30 family transposase